MNKNKEEIIELLQSADLELRMIGLSYLNENKRSNDLYIQYVPMFDCFKVTRIAFGTIHFSFNEMYKDILTNYGFVPEILECYVTRCLS